MTKGGDALEYEGHYPTYWEWTRTDGDHWVESQAYLYDHCRNYDPELPLECHIEILGHVFVSHRRIGNLYGIARAGPRKSPRLVAPVDSIATQLCLVVCKGISANQSYYCDKYSQIATHDDQEDLAH